MGPGWEPQAAEAGPRWAMGSGCSLRSPVLSQGQQGALRAVSEQRQHDWHMGSVCVHTHVLVWGNVDGLPMGGAFEDS